MIEIIILPAHVPMTMNEVHLDGTERGIGIIPEIVTVIVIAIVIVNAKGIGTENAIEVETKRADGKGSHRGGLTTVATSGIAMGIHPAAAAMQSRAGLTTLQYLGWAHNV